MNKQLAERAVACRHWRWLPGMRSVDSDNRKWRRVVETWAGEWHGIRTCRGEVLPDLTDPATVGCLLALVREAWGRPGAVCSCLPSDAVGWLCCGEYGATEAEALVAALEAAP